jgi:hypothetical protein
MVIFTSPGYFLHVKVSFSSCNSFFACSLENRTSTSFVKLLSPADPDFITILVKLNVFSLPFRVIASVMELLGITICC